MKDAGHPEWMFAPQVTLDGKYLVLYISKDTSRVSTHAIDSDEI